MIYQVAPNPELQKDVLEDSERLHDEAEDALEANEKEANEIAKHHGEDTKDTDDVVSKSDLKDLKSMYLSEALFEDLDKEDYDLFRSYVVEDLIKNCLLFRGDINGYDVRRLLSEIDDSDIMREVENRIEEERDDYNYGFFDDIEDSLNSLTIWKTKNESLHEELSPKGKQLVAELKRELGPELQKKVVALMKDLQSSLTKDTKKVVERETEKKEPDMKESLAGGKCDGWIAFYSPTGRSDDTQRLEITRDEADSLYQAKLFAISKLRVPKSKMGMLTIKPAYNESLKESWSVYYIDDIPEEGTIFENEDDARKFQAEMGEDWEVVQLPDTKWDMLSDEGLFDESLKEEFDWDFQSEEESKIQKALKRKLNTVVNVSVSTNDDDNGVEVWVEPYPEDEDVCIKVLEKFGYDFVKDCGDGSNNGTKELLFKGTRG